MKLLKETIKNLHFVIFIIIILSMIICFFNVMLSKFIVYIIDGIVMENTNLPKYLTIFFYDDTLVAKIIVSAIMMLLIALIIALSDYLRNKFNTKLRLGMNQNIKKVLLYHSTYLDYNSYAHYENNQILQRISGDANNYISYINEKLNLVLNTFFYTVFSLGVIIQLNFKVCIILAVIITIIIIMSIWYCATTKSIVSNKIILSEGIIKKTMNAIYNPKMIKMNNNQNLEITKFNKNSDEYLKCDIKEIDYLIYYELIASGIKALSTPIIYLVCGIMIINGHMQVGELMAILTYSTVMLNYFQNLIYAIEGINDFLVPANRIKNYLKLSEEDLIKKGLVTNNYQKIEFRNVKVTLENQIVLENLNFTIRGGENIYLVGQNGSGKSVIAKILLGFIDYEGDVFIDDINLKKLNKINLRQNIGLCFQEPYIFSDTIKNNIDCFACNSIDKIKEVATICQLDKEIEKMPNKYNEVLKERGINLSGGQKQRINIARLISENKKILIFDDVLSKLDNNTKNKIINNLADKFPSNINIFITHDLLKIPLNSRVLFIDNKKIYDSTNKNLISSNANYKKLIEICKNDIGGIHE